METKKERVNRLIDYFAQGKKAAFGRILGISGAAVAKWVNTGEFNAGRILQAFPEVNAHWLRTGEGEMIVESAKAGITQSIGNGNSNAYNIVGSSTEELVRLKAENESLKREVEWLRRVVENYLSKGKN